MSTTTKYQYQHTLGCEPLLLGRITEHGPFMTVAYLVLGGIGMSIGGLPLAILSALFATNDVLAIGSDKAPSEPVTLFTSERDTARVIAPAEDNDYLASAIDALDDDSDVVEVKAKPVLRDRPVAPSASFDHATYSAGNPFSTGSAPQVDQTLPPKGGKDSAFYKKAVEATTGELDAIIQEEAKKIAKGDTAQTTSIGTNAVGVAGQLVTLEDGYLRSWFITGLTGSGKGIFTTYALLLAKRQLKGVSLWGVDPKADPAEFTRWAIIPENQRLHFDAGNPGLDREARIRIEEGLKDLFERFYADKSPYKILLLDELPAVAAVVSAKYRSQLVSFISRVGSMGRSRGLAVWVGSNAVGLRENGLSKSGRDFFHEIYLVTPRSSDKVTSHSSYPGPQINEEVMAVTGRAAWASTTGDRWYSVPSAYKEAVDELPIVAAPASLGKATFAGDEGAVGVRELTDEIVEAMKDAGRRRMAIDDLAAEGMPLAHFDEAALQSMIIPLLKKKNTELSLTKTMAKGWVVVLATPEVEESQGGVIESLFGG